MGIAVLGFGLPVVSFELMDRAVFPERTLFVLLGGAFGPIRVGAFHSLTGVGYYKGKASNFSLIADYLWLHRNSRSPRISACDPSEKKREGAEQVPV